MSAVPAMRLAGAPNFRDLGGYRTTTGRTVKHGLVYRSGDSATLTDADLELLARIGPKLIVDLRSNKEAAAYPPRWPLAADGELIAANVMADMRSGDRNIMESLLQSPNAQGAREMMLHTYRELPVACAPVISSVFRRLAQGAGTPTIFHCTYGRDRTGFFAAMLLHALEVPREAIIADYLKSRDFMDLLATAELTRVLLRSNFNLALDDAGLEVLGPPHQVHMEAALKAVDDLYGSPDEYLLDLGIDATIQAGLRQHLLQ